MNDIYCSDTELEVGKVYIVPALKDSDDNYHRNIPILVISESNYEEYMEQHDLKNPTNSKYYKYFYEIHTD